MQRREFTRKIIKWRLKIAYLTTNFKLHFFETSVPRDNIALQNLNNKQNYEKLFFCTFDDKSMSAQTEFVFA